MRPPAVLQRARLTVSPGQIIGCSARTEATDPEPCSIVHQPSVQMLNSIIVVITIDTYVMPHSPRLRSDSEHGSFMALDVGMKGTGHGSQAPLVIATQLSLHLLRALDRGLQGLPSTAHLSRIFEISTLQLLRIMFGNAAAAAAVGQAQIGGWAVQLARAG